MFEALTWWLVLEILALATLPITAYLFRSLPDKGYAFAKPIGIILPAYVFWLSSSFGILDNMRSTMVFVVAITGLVAWIGCSEGRREVSKLWRTRRGTIVIAEILFALAFAVWCLIRSYSPDIAATEKPMEIAFLNGTMRSIQFPPVDPWLSGYSISYYYFGYVMVAMIAKISGIQASIAFNLAIAMLFALAVVGAFGLAFNLAAGRRVTNEDDRSYASGFGPHPKLPEERGAVACGLLGAAFVAIMGNLEGLLEMFYSRGALPQSFWTWLNIQNLDKPYLSAKWYPTEWFWWFRASRVIGDFDPITKVSRDYTINEFPFFSFLLGDLHPHVLALPFVFVAMGLALSVLKSDDMSSWRDVVRRESLRMVLWSVIIGGLGFINSWDMPTYLILFVLAFAVKKRLNGQDWIKESIFFGLTLLTGSIILYLPFYLGFSSQVRGLGVVLERTKLHHFIIFWGPFIFFALAFLLIKLGIVCSSARESVPEGLLSGLNPNRHNVNSSVSKITWKSIGIVAIAMILLMALKATVIALLLPLIFVSFELLLGNRLNTLDKETNFVILLILLGTVLLLICEVLFVRDFFGNRMNTVFKVYYQVWQMLAIASAYAAYFFLSRDWHQKVSVAVRIGTSASLTVAVLLAIGSFVYPVTATITKISEGLGNPTLDGQAFMGTSQRGDYEAIAWLNREVAGTPVILEATGGSYTSSARISAFTGLPTVIGWDGHELQWRGSGEEASRRKSEVDAIYLTTDDQLARSLLKKYNVSYVYVGNLEREAYGKAGSLDKFAKLGSVVYQRAGVTIYKLGLD